MDNNNNQFLYVEDDPLSREIMLMIMENAMQVDLKQITVFADSTDFLKRVQAISTRPNVILLDIHVQPYDGFQMLEMLRNEPMLKDARIIALTASVMNEEVARLRKAGFDGAIAKPLNVHTFPSLVERVLKGETVWHIA